ncbi:MAG: Asp-tRNA(Asn)/Glu-tRNA(Gln) amidotransferase subunit GatC [Candidatus Omnitrophica bacterium]|nr:Asp-tRNA(Asn)/Glu-tRNA(Gln) amidotransferase subunit GatC [Candidatus Omnitrophota bacterium]
MPAFDIDRVAELARIRLKSDERAKLEKDLQSIIQYVEKLRELNTEEVEPTSHVLNLENVMKEYTPRDAKVSAHVLQHAPVAEQPYFKVPKVVDN